MVRVCLILQENGFLRIQVTIECQEPFLNQKHGFLEEVCSEEILFFQFESIVPEQKLGNQLEEMNTFLGIQLEKKEYEEQNGEFHLQRNLEPTRKRRLKSM
ncbi:unnamed protein product [Paramecium octaurelia]|uniref:Uncharacterized protein n=1 Tax=Paramecium octaurelia TaxID=43137 RepID=A0A8S1YP77_PAROT|nr:unnamed protein product [Paramecium octaurelia]